MQKVGSQSDTLRHDSHMKPHSHMSECVCVHVHRHMCEVMCTHVRVLAIFALRRRYIHYIALLRSFILSGAHVLVPTFAIQ